MSAQHDDPASTISYATARKLFADPTPRGRRLLELFAREQVLRIEVLKEEFGLNQNGLNALLGGLTRRFQRLQGDEGFHIYIPKMKAWAIGHASGTSLRKAMREEERSRQAELSFRGE